MVTPDCRRRAVVVLVERFGVSQRRACRVVGLGDEHDQIPTNLGLAGQAKPIGIQAHLGPGSGSSAHVLRFIRTHRGDVILSRPDPEPAAALDSHDTLAAGGVLGTDALDLHFQPAGRGAEKDP